jgi:alpha-glucosidase (family GH31 glycosyl hydrolase)
MKNVILGAGAGLLVAFQSIVAAGEPAKITPLWEQVAPGVWKTIVGQAEDLTLLGAAAVLPETGALKAMPGAAFPLDQNEIEGQMINGKVALRFPLALDEDVYGLGVDFKAVRRTGSTFMLHSDHWSGQTGRTHAPVPLYISTKGYGVLINSARYLKLNIGVSVRLAARDKPPVIDRTTGGARWSSMPRSDSVEVLVPAAGVEVLVFGGPTPMDAVRRYNLFCGGGALPPKWGLGFLARTPTAYRAEDALHEVAAFRQHGIPLDMIGLEPGWQDQAYPCSFEWDKTRFPDPAGFLDQLEKLHVRANLWFNPYISPTAPLYGKLLPFAGSHLVWNGIVPDYTIPAARKIFSDHLKRKIVDLNPAALGGFKIDEVDGGDGYLWAEVTTFPSGHDAEQLRQTYGVLLQRLILDLYRQENRRTFGQVRGTNAGASSFPFVIYNDNYDFAEYITAVGNTAFAGVLWSPEVRSGKSEDIVRRMQAVCFSPLALFNGWATDMKLWSHPEAVGPIRDAIMLRMRLLPYWYTTFAQYHFEGTPVIRPLQLTSGFGAGSRPESGQLDATDNPYAISRVVEVKDQYMVGDALLVAPIAPGAKTRKVVLPAGKWFDFYSGEFVGENQTVEVAPPLSQTPIVVRDGGMVPMIGERQWAPGPDEILPLEVRHYGLKPGSLALYDDDGETFNYENGVCSWTQFSVARDESGAWKGTIAPVQDGKPWHYSAVKWVFMTRW